MLLLQVASGRPSAAKTTDTDTPVVAKATGTVRPSVVETTDASSLNLCIDSCTESEVSELVSDQDIFSRGT